MALVTCAASEAEAEAEAEAAHCKKNENYKYYLILRSLNFPPFFNFVYKQTISCQPVQKAREIQN